MPMIPLRNVGSGGLVPDQVPYDVELTQFPAGNNVQMFSGRIGKALGYVDVVSVEAAPTHVAGWFVDGNDSLIIGTNNDLYRYNGTTVTKVTAATYPSGYSNSPHWQSAQLGTGFLANNGSDRPQYMAATGSAFANLANWPTNLRSDSIRPFLSFLVLPGYTDGSTEYPYTVRWSDEFDPTSVPGSWDITSTTNLAGETILGGRLGRLVDCLPLAGINVVYAEQGAYAMSFIGAPLVFAFRELFDDGGLLNRGAMCVFDNRHFVVGRDDIYVHDGSTKQSVSSRRVKDAFFDSLADTRSVFVTNDTAKNEIWVCYADKNATNTETANRALVWDYSSDAWTFRDLPGVRALCVGPAVGSSSGSTWDGLDVSWDSWSALWAELGASTQAKNTRLFSAGHAGLKIHAHNETFGAAGSAYTSFVESSKIDLDAVLEGRSVERVVQIKRIVPQIKGAGAVQIRVGSSNSPQGAVTWKTTKSFNIESDYKVDTRVSGRYLSLRVESADINGYWTLSGFDIDVEEVSER